MNGVAGEPEPAGTRPAIDSLTGNLETAEDRIFREGDEARTAHFRDWLAGILRHQGLSQESAARRLGVSLKTVNRWLRGHSEPRMRELRRVRDVFGEPPLS